MKYSDAIADWLLEEGYTHCFFVAGGNIMHLLNSVREKFECIPFVHEFGAAVAAEYFTAASASKANKAFVLVTAGPGFTNTITAIASAWTESRELLVIGGQVKSADLSRGELRQRGIQEINGIELAIPICKAFLQIDSPVGKSEFIGPIRAGSSGRKGPVFIEICLDAQGSNFNPIESGKETSDSTPSTDEIPLVALENCIDAILKANRPVLLIGGGCDHHAVKILESKLSNLGIPIMTTWNGADRISGKNKNYFGRPNTWGQRYSNVLIQQSDLLVAVGTRLGVQQTGFAWDEFIPVGQIIQIDIDKAELEKSHPQVEFPLQMDSITFLEKLLEAPISPGRYSEWLDFCQTVRDSVPVLDEKNVTSSEYVDPFWFTKQISEFVEEDASIIPCSSGGSFTVVMQTFVIRDSQRMVTNKGMASMGYGLSGAIGAALARPTSNTYLFEGDGGFAQNLQELGTVAANRLRLKMFVFSNGGYASIRMTQRNYFNGAWVGCDAQTGLGLPNWEKLAESYGIPYRKVTRDYVLTQEFADSLLTAAPALFEIPTDPEQTYFPKITSKVLSDGSMKSNPLHLMDPPLNVELARKVFKYLD
jgi:acetolactate synthase-1/2/3 large subunit